MKKDIRNIKLPNVPVERNSEGKNHADSRRFYDWAERVYMDAA